MFEIAVCDDCDMDRECLIKYIKKKANQYEMRIHQFSSGMDLLSVMNEIRFSAIFLDIQMKGMDGDETAKRIRHMDANLVLVFYTGFAEPSPRSIEVQPYRYIMKNMSDYQITAYVEASLDRMNEITSTSQLVANLNKKQIVIDSRHVVYIEKYRKNTRVHLAAYSFKLYNIEAEEDGGCPDIRIQEPLEDIYEKLKKYGFGCPHASYIINFSYLRACTNKELELADIPGIFPIARSKAKLFHELKERFIRAKYVKGV